MTDCIPEAVSGRADPDRQGRHQHSLRDLDAISAENGGMADGRQAPAPQIDVAAPPIHGSDGTRPPRAISSIDAAKRAALGLPALRRPGEPAECLALRPTAARAATQKEHTQIRFVSPEWPGIRSDLPTGICTMAKPLPADLTPKETAMVAAVRRAQELCGGIRPGNISLAPSLLRQYGRRISSDTVSEVEAYRWEISADGDGGYSLSHRRMRCAALGGASPTEVLAACRTLVEAIEAAAERAISELSGPDPTAAIAAEAQRLCGEDRWLAPLYQYHLAAAWVRLREALPVPVVRPVRQRINPPASA
jgi:hypothetical protein